MPSPHLATAMACFALCCHVTGATEVAPESKSMPAHSSAPQAIAWRGDYHEALACAQEGRKIALISLFHPHEASQADRFEREVLSQPATVRAGAERFVPIRLPTDARVTSSGKEIVLLDHPAFAEMHG